MLLNGAIYLYCYIPFTDISFRKCAFIKIFTFISSRYNLAVLITLTDRF